MTKVFLDTNILLDLLASRSPYDVAARQIFDWTAQNQIEIYASALYFCNIAYILRKLQKETNISEILENLASIVHITPVNGGTVNDALRSSFKDFEDALQHFSALTVSNDVIIVTRNPTDFSSSTAKIMTSDDFIRFFR